MALLSLPLFSKAAMDEKTVTYSDFQYIRYIAASMSHVYFATTEGITRYNKMEQRWEEPLTSSIGIDHTDIIRIWVDEFDKKLYASTTVNSYEYDILFDKWFPLSELPSLEIQYRHISAPDIMYLPGGFNYNQREAIIDPEGRDFQLTDIINDGSGNMWVGTWGYGAGVSMTTSNVVDFLPFGLIQKRVDAIDNYNGELWIGGANYGSYRTGLTKFDPEELVFEQVESGYSPDFPDGDILCIETDDDHVYAGTDIGLIIIDRNDNQILKRVSRRYGLDDEYILSLKKYGDSLFIGTTSGVEIYSLDEDSVFSFRPGQFRGEYIYDLEKTDSSIWIAATSGAFQYNFNTGKLQQFQDPNLIIFSEAQSLAIFNNFLWFASSNGLVKLDLKTAKNYGYPMPLYNLTGQSLAVNETIAAIATNSGLKFVYHKDPDKINEITFDQNDGFPSDKILSVLLDGDFIWVGTDQGLTRFLWNDPYRVD